MYIKIIGIVAALAAVGLVVWQTVGTKTAEAPTVNGEEAAVETEDQTTIEPRQGSGSLSFIRGAYQSGSCTFSSTNDDGSESSGTMWFDGEKVAVEAATRVNGELYTSNMINDGETTYVWSGTAGGMMAMKFENSDQTTATETTTSHQFDLEQQVDYDCDPGTVDASLFMPPASITFTNYADIQNGVFQGSLRGQPEGMDFMPEVQ